MNTYIYNKVVKVAVKWFLPFYLFAFLPLLTSCSESDDEAFDSADWKRRNEEYFQKVYNSHLPATDNAFVLPNWSQPSSMSLSDIDYTSCIVVDVLERGEGTTCPYYTDSVQVHYSGRLIPTDDYPAGYEFDRSWLTVFDPDVDMPATFAVNGVKAGFSTAVQHMHRGDHWRVTIPYQLGYGTTVASLIPAYSTLIFDIRLVDFWFEKEGDRE